MQALSRFVGKDVNLYGPETADHDGFIETGRLVSIEDGFLFLAQGDTAAPNLAVSLSHVMVVAVREEEPQLKPITGGKGKVHRLRRDAAPAADHDEDGEPRE